MIQTTIDDLDWLTDPNWIPKEVHHYTDKVEVTDEEFDEQQARSYGYDSVKQMNAHNLNNDRMQVIEYGDKKKGLI